VKHLLAWLAVAALVFCSAYGELNLIERAIDTDNALWVAGAAAWVLLCGSAGAYVATKTYPL